MKTISSTMIRALCLLLCIVTVALLCGTLTACDIGKTPDGDESPKDDGTGSAIEDQSPTSVLYAKAKALGFEGTLEDFLALCKGADGVGIHSLTIDENGNLIAYYTNDPKTGKVLGKVKDDAATDTSTSCAQGHTPGEWTGKERTSLCEDIILYKKCTKCAVVLDVDLEQGAGHLDLDIDPVVEPTCTTAGCFNVICEECETIVIENYNVGPLGHDPQWKTVKEANSKQDGLREQRCRRCSLFFSSEVIPAAPKYDLNGREMDDLPDTLNYVSERISILYWDDVENPEFEQKTVTGDNVRDAIYDRNHQIEVRLNVELDFVGLPANAANRANFLAHVSAVYNACTQDYDLIASYSRTQGLLATNGFLYDISSIQNSYIDLNKPYWPNNIVNQVSLDDHCYFLTGDISTNSIYMMNVLFLNKDLLRKYQLTTPYASVRDGSWTIDKLITMTSGRHKDTTNNGIDVYDTFGFTGWTQRVASLYNGAGLRFIEADSTNTLKVSDDFTSSTAATLVGKLQNWAADDGVWIGVRDTDTTYIGTAPFREGRALFTLQHFDFGSNLLSADFEYGILPLPKYAATQEGYLTSMLNPYSLYGIFCDFDTRGDQAATLTMLTAVLECWASESYRLTTPEIFEVNLQLKFSIGQDETDMFEYARDAICLDLGQIFESELATVTQMPLDSALAGENWADTCAAYKSTVSEKLATLVQDYKEKLQQMS